MDYKELIERLNNAAGGPEGRKMCYDSAAAITDLLARAEAAEARAEEADLCANIARNDYLAVREKNQELFARVERADADNKKLIAAMMQLKRTDRPEWPSVVYKLEYDSSLSHKTMEEVAGILFRGLMDADLKLRGKKDG